MKLTAAATTLPVWRSNVLSRAVRIALFDHKRYEEIVRLSREVHRLTELLRRHGIEPDEGTSRSA